MTEIIDGEIRLDDHLTATYAIYVTVFEQYRAGRIALKRANNLVGSVLSASKTAWRVAGITPEALELIAQSGFKSGFKGVQRAHLHNRIDTIRALIEGTTPRTKDELFDFWRERDKTILCLSSQNKDICKIPKILFDNPHGELFTNGYVGYSFRKRKEGDFLRSLCL